MLLFQSSTAVKNASALENSLKAFGLSFMKQDLAKLSGIDTLVQGPFGRSLLAELGASRLVRVRGLDGAGIFLPKPDGQIRDDAVLAFSKLSRLRADFLGYFEKHRDFNAPEIKNVNDAFAHSVRTNGLRYGEASTCLGGILNGNLDCDTSSLLLIQFAMEKGLKPAGARLEEADFSAHYVVVFPSTTHDGKLSIAGITETNFALLNDFATSKEMLDADNSRRVLAAFSVPRRPAITSDYVQKKNGLLSMDEWKRYAYGWQLKHVVSFGAAPFQSPSEMSFSLLKETGKLKRLEPLPAQLEIEKEILRILPVSSARLRAPSRRSRK